MSTRVDVLHVGYTEGDRTAGTISLVRDGDAVIVVDPGMVARRSSITEALAALGVAPEAVTHVFLSHHHPDHTMNVALFPAAEVFDFASRYVDDLWVDHSGDGHRLGPNSALWLTPGHSNEDATLIVTADNATYAMTHLWWKGDRTPLIDPYAPDQDVLERNRERVLAAVDIVVPGHGAPFRTADLADRG
jgi:glyoxylase-like metal-dependent hydrolase (beta-lactamase superfamily II)